MLPIIASPDETTGREFRPGKYGKLILPTVIDGHRGVVLLDVLHIFFHAMLFPSTDWTNQYSRPFFQLSEVILMNPFQPIWGAERLVKKYAFFAGGGLSWF